MTPRIECRSIVAIDTSIDPRLTCRPIHDRHSTNNRRQSVECRPTYVSGDSLLLVGRQAVDARPILGRYFIYALLTPMVECRSIPSIDLHPPTQQLPRSQKAHMFSLINKISLHNMDNARFSVTRVTRSHTKLTSLYGQLQSVHYIYYLCHVYVLIARCQKTTKTSCRLIILLLIQWHKKVICCTTVFLPVFDPCRLQSETFHHWNGIRFLQFQHLKVTVKILKMVMWFHCRTEVYVNII